MEYCENMKEMKSGEGN